MVRKFDSFAKKLLQPLAYILKKVNPNYISISGVVFVIIFFICIILRLYIFAVIVFLLNGVDILDGMIAHSQKKVTAFGGFLDSTIDRFCDFIIITSFAFGGIVSWTIIAPLLLVSYMISYIRSRTELATKGKLTAKVGIIERPDRLCIIFVSLILYILFPKIILFKLNIISFIFILLIILSIVTVIQRIKFAYKNIPSH